ncbi:hypothetical protein ACHAXS_010429 [Conticribra weissflogii]
MPRQQRLRLIETIIFVVTSALFTSIQANHHPPEITPLSSEECDDSFPLAPSDLSISPSIQHKYSQHHHRLLLSLPDNPRANAPLCPDGIHIDIRRLTPQCNAGACWSNFYQQCTFECTWNDYSNQQTVATTPPPTPPPTPEPTQAIVETVHPVRLHFKNVPDGFRVTLEMKSTILRYVTEIYETYLGNAGLELVDVAFASLADSFTGQRLRRRYLRSSASDDAHDDGASRKLAYTYYLPLRVTVRGPADVSDFALSYVIEIMREHIADLGQYLQSLEGEEYVSFTFESLRVESFEEEDWQEMLDSENPPTMKPTSPPKTEPTNVSIMSTTTNTDEVVLEQSKNYWWVWLIVAIILLLLCICIVAICMRRSHREEKNVKTTYNINHQYYHDPKKPRARPPQAKRPNSHRHFRQDKSNKSVVTSDSSRRHRHDGPRDLRPPRPIPKFSSLEEESSEDEESYAETQAEASAVPTTDATAAAAVAVPVGMDPPEELAMVMYNPHQPDAASTNRLALEPPQNFHGHHRHHHHHHNALVLYDPNNNAEADPTGEKIPKTKSLYAAEVYSIENSTSGEEPKGTKAPKYQSIYFDSQQQRAWAEDSGNFSEDPPSEYYPHSAFAPSTTNDKDDPTTSKKSTKKKKKKKSSSKRYGTNDGVASTTKTSRVERIKRSLSFTNSTAHEQDFREELDNVKASSSTDEEQSFATRDPDENSRQHGNPNGGSNGNHHYRNHNDRRTSHPYGNSHDEDRTYATEEPKQGSAVDQTRLRQYQNVSDRHQSSKKLSRFGSFSKHMSWRNGRDDQIEEESYSEA